MTPSRAYQKLILVLAALVPVLVVWQLLSLAQSGHKDDIQLAKSKEMPQVRPAWPVHINKPNGPPRVQTDVVGMDGRTITVSCSSCHSTREPNRQLRDGSNLKEFHQNLTTVHGDLTCLSCHNQDDYDTLRLADNQKVEYSEVMRLCAQCHGPQYRDYQNGSHGGMTGYWDQEKGPRYRNNCVDCHDPHAPAYTGMHPAPGPNDRFMQRSDEHGGTVETEGGHS